MRYLLRTNADYEHLAKKFKRAVLTLVRRDGSEMAICLRSFLFVSAFLQAIMAFTSSITRSVMWVLAAHPNLETTHEGDFCTCHRAVPSSQITLIKALQLGYQKEDSL